MKKVNSKEKKEEPIKSETGKLAPVPKTAVKKSPISVVAETPTMLTAPKSVKPSFGTSNFPRHSLEKALRIPIAILDQNAGQETSEKEAAKL